MSTLILCCVKSFDTAFVDIDSDSGFGSGSASSSDLDSDDA
jgi:hypothetical protein